MLDCFSTKRYCTTLSNYYEHMYQYPQPKGLAVQQPKATPLKATLMARGNVFFSYSNPSHWMR